MQKSSATIFCGAGFESYRALLRKPIETKLYREFPMPTLAQPGALPRVRHIHPLLRKRPVVNFLVLRRHHHLEPALTSSARSPDNHDLVRPTLANASSCLFTKAKEKGMPAERLFEHFAPNGEVRNPVRFICFLLL